LQRYRKGRLFVVDLADGETVEVQGSAKKPYVLSNIGGVYSCTCPAWRNQSRGIDVRTCKHLKTLRGAAVEVERVGQDAARGPVRKKKDGAESKKPPLLLAHSWEDHEDPQGWWISEKLDGVRAYWDGKQFISRLGNPFLAPKWFTADLPKTPLDGELWIGRKRFQETVSVVRRVKGGDAWKQVSYQVFDAPASQAPFEERLEALSTLLPAVATFAQRLEHVLCEGAEHLQRELARVEGLGGEGLMLRRPGSRYETGRSSTLLKVKSFHDAEAKVIGHSAGKGKHKGKVGSLTCVAADGTEFSVGTGLSDAERKSPPPIGAIVTYRYQELTKAGVPRFPSFVRVRHDAEWPPAGSQDVDKKAPARRKAKKTAAPKATAQTLGSEGTGRYFECVDGKSSKFWEIRVAGNGFTVTYGRIGTAGRAQTKTFASEEASSAAAETLIGKKTGKGYVETERKA
jgi:DNA ligase 1